MAIPIFANAIKELDTYLAPLGIDIVHVISSYDPTVLQNIVHCFVGIVAVQVSVDSHFPTFWFQALKWTERLNWL